MSKITVCLIACLGIAASAADAVVIYAGTSVAVTKRDCEVAGTTGCDELGTATTVYGGLPGDLTSSASASWTGYGSASGSAALSGAAGAPVLRGSATSELGTRQNTNTIGLQQYTYTGLTQTSRTFSGTLTYSQTLTGDYWATAGGGGVGAFIGVFKLPGGFEVGATSESNFDSLFSPQLQTGFVELGYWGVVDFFSNPNGSETFDVTVNLNPGDSVFTWALLQTPAPNGSTVDASNTLVTRWDNSANLVPAAVVPEPGTLALLSLSLAGLAASRRRKT